MEGYVSVVEAAKALDVSRGRVDQLIRAGRLDAVKFAGRWAVDVTSVARQARTVSGAGTSRAMSARSLWALARLLDGAQAGWSTASDRYKLVRRARNVVTVDQVRRWAEARYRTTFTLSVARDDTDRLLADDRTARTGVSATAHLDTWDEVEVVVTQTATEHVIADHRLEKYLTGDIKATVHVVDDVIGATTNRLVVALDLADSSDSRTKDLGRRQLEDLISQMRSL